MQNEGGCKMSESIAIEERITALVQQLPDVKKGQVLDFVKRLKHQEEQAEVTQKKLQSHRQLPKSIARLVEEGKLELSDCSDFGIDREEMKATMSFSELREQLSKISVPIEDYIRRERDKREQL